MSCEVASPGAELIRHILTHTQTFTFIDIYDALACSATDPDDLSAKPKNDHLDCSVILNNLNDLEELQLTYGYIITLAPLLPFVYDNYNY